jgi:hypothetical protein
MARLTGHGERLGADFQREDFTGDDPGYGTPGAGEEEDVDTDKSNQKTLDRQVLGSNDSTSNGNDELADSHANGTEEQKLAATPLLDEPQTGNSRSNVDAGSDHGNDEGVLDTSVLEEACAVVEDEVDASQLLETLKKTAGCETLAKVALEAVEVGSLAERQFVLVVGSNLSKFLNESGVFDIKLAQLGE